MTIGSNSLQKNGEGDRVVGDEPSLYQVILGKPFDRIVGAMSSTYMQCVRFIDQGGIRVIRGYEQVV